MATMYSAKVNSPSTELVNSITDSQTTIELGDASVLPDAPNLLTIGDGEDAETCRYTDITGDVVTVERGFEGVAKTWDAGEPVARNFTAYDHNTFKSNIEGIEEADVFTTTENGLVPAPTSANLTKFLRGDGTWQEITISEPSEPSEEIEGGSASTEYSKFLDGGSASSTYTQQQIINGGVA